MRTQQLSKQTLLPFLVTDRVTEKTLGAVYAVSIQSAQNIANSLWINDKGTLKLFDLREEFNACH